MRDDPLAVVALRSGGVVSPRNGDEPDCQVTGPKFGPPGPFSRCPGSPVARIIATCPHAPQPGCLRLFLSFKFARGVRDVLNVADADRGHLLAVRGVVARRPERFVAWDLPAIWATVAFLYVNSRDEARAYASGAPR